LRTPCNASLKDRLASNVTTWNGNPIPASSKRSLIASITRSLMPRMSACPDDVQ